MKSLFLAAAAVLALTAGSAQAQHPIHHGGFGHGHGFGMSHGGGWFSGKLGGGLLSGIFCNHGSLFGSEGHGHGFGGFGGGLGGGFGAGLFGGGGAGGPPIPVVDPRMGGGAGQLVFPQHPFVRSPRDYFMTEER